jgi:hypothetical protein
MILSTAYLSLFQYTFCVVLLLSKKNVYEFTKKVEFFMWSALPKTQKCVVTYDNTPTAATVAVTTGKVSLRPCTVRGTNFYQLQATCKVKEKRVCHTQFFIIAINFFICTKLHSLKSVFDNYSRQGTKKF